MYVKLFSEILDSSLWSQSASIKLVWITLLAKADQFGVARVSVPGLARAAALSLEETLEAIEYLLAPDPFSKSKAEEGRRIELIDGGIRLINYEKYREIAKAEDRKEQIKEAQAGYRGRSKAIRSDQSGSEGINSKPSEEIRSDQIKTNPEGGLFDDGPDEPSGVHVSQAAKLEAREAAYRKAFIAGTQRGLGRAFVFPTEPWHQRDLNSLLGHSGGKRGPELIRWLEAAAFRYCKSGTKDITPGGLLKSLNAGEGIPVRVATMSPAVERPSEPVISAEQHKAFADELLRKMGGQ